MNVPYCICDINARGDESTQEMEDIVKSANPEEIVIDDEEDEEAAPVEGWRLILKLNQFCMMGCIYRSST